MSDPYQSNAKSVIDPGVRHVLIVPNDGADLAVRPRAIFCQSAGTIVIRDEMGIDLPYTMNAGTVLAFRPVRVLATGTSGTFYGMT